MRPPTAKLDVYLFVPEEPDRLSQFVTLQDRKSKVPAELEEDAVLLTEKAAERLGVAVGDTITVQRNDDHRQAEFTVGGVVENYVQNYIYLSPALYEEGYHTQPEMNQTIAVVPDGSQETVTGSPRPFWNPIRCRRQFYRRHQGFFPKHHQKH